MHCDLTYIELYIIIILHFWRFCRVGISRMYVIFSSRILNIVNPGDLRFPNYFRPVSIHALYVCMHVYTHMCFTYVCVILKQDANVNMYAILVLYCQI